MLKLKKIRIVVLLFIGALVGLLPAALPAAGFGGGMGFGFKKPDPKRDNLQHARADRWKFVGRTVFLEGNVFIPYGNMLISADSAMAEVSILSQEISKIFVVINILDFLKIKFQTCRDVGADKFVPQKADLCMENTAT